MTPQTVSKESLPALYAIALEFYRNGKYGEAKDIFQLLTISDADDRKHWMGLASCYKMLKEYAEAIECFSMAALLDPHEPMAHWHAADSYFASGKQTEAMVALESAIEAAKKHSTLQSLVDQLLVVQERWERSRICQT